jgi:hypothetical protein
MFVRSHLSLSIGHADAGSLRAEGRSDQNVTASAGWCRAAVRKGLSIGRGRWVLRRLEHVRVLEKGKGEHVEGQVYLPSCGNP